MRHTEPDQENLLRENEELRRQIRELKTNGNGPHAALPAMVWHPSAITIWAIFLAAIILTVVAFFSGYLPLRKQREIIAAEAREQDRALPRVEVIEVARSSDKSAIELPGNIQAITEAPILARADGYIQRRAVDIGDRVRNGQILAEIEAPEMDEQIRQAKAALQLAQSGVDQAVANYERGKADEE